MSVLQRRQAAVTPISPRPLLTRTRFIAPKVPRRPLWTFLYAYRPVLRLPPVTPGLFSGGVVRSAGQMREISRLAAIFPGAEPWNARDLVSIGGHPLGRNIGLWQRAALPLVPLPAGSVMTTRPRFPYVWSVPPVNPAPLSHPVTSSGS
jgi:hypothetical protein